MQIWTPDMKNTDEHTTVPLQDISQTLPYTHGPPWPLWSGWSKQSVLCSSPWRRSRVCHHPRWSCWCSLWVTLSRQNLTLRERTSELTASQTTMDQLWALQIVLCVWEVSKYSVYWLKYRLVTLLGSSVPFKSYIWRFNWIKTFCLKVLNN